MLTLALSSWSFHKQLPFFNTGAYRPDRVDPEIALDAFPGIAASLGIHELEVCQAHLASTDHTYLDIIRAAIDAAGCRVINMPIDVGDLSAVDPAGREEGFKAIEGWIDAAHYLGAPCARVNTGHAAPGDEEAALSRVVEGYRRLSAYCAERTMTVLLENHGGLSASPDAIMALVEAVDSPHFRLCPDFGNFDPEVREEGVRRMLPYAAIVHAKVYGEDAAANFDRASLLHFLEIVREGGYSGSISIELEGEPVIDARGGVRAIAETIQEWMRDHE